MISVTFIVTCALIVIVPGPSFAVIVSQTLRNGAPAGLLVVVGNTTALFVWAIASAAGLTALAAASELGFTAIKIVGASYLCWLGLQMLLSSNESAWGHGPATGSLPRNADFRPSAAYFRGLVTNLTNPKPAALYLALLPQFLAADARVVSLLVLAGVHILISAIWYVTLVAGVTSIRAWLHSVRLHRWIVRANGLALVALGIRLLKSARPAG